MLEEDGNRIGRLIAEIQQKLRQDLLDDLVESEEDLQSLFDPDSYSHALDEVRDKYVDKLWALQGILHEIANLDDGHRRRRTEVMSISTDSPEALTQEVNKALRSLEGCAIQDVKFLKGEDSQWVAFITYLANPFDRSREEQMQDQNDRE